MLDDLEKKAGLPKEYLFLAGASLPFLGLTMLLGISTITSLVGFLYPTFASFRAIETKTKGDDTQWLIYWTVYAFFQVIESFTHVILHYVPFYYVFKLAFLIFMMHPSTRGAEFLYNSFLREALRKNESRIDEAIQRAGKGAHKVGGEAVKAGLDMAAQGAASASAAMHNGEKND